MFERFIEWNACSLHKFKRFTYWNASCKLKIAPMAMHSDWLKVLPVIAWKSRQKSKKWSNQSKSTRGLESSPCFWTLHFKRSVKPRQRWLTQTTDGNIKTWKCQRSQLCWQGNFEGNQPMRY